MSVLARLNALGRPGIWLRRARFAGVRGIAAAVLLGLGGCYGSYSYSSYRYDPPCEPARVVVHDTYCAPRPVVVIDRHYYGGHYHGHYRGHSHYSGHGRHGGSHRGGRW